MNNWKLPTSVTSAGVVWEIETDFRIVIDVLIAMENPDYDNEDKCLYLLMSMVKDFDNLPEDTYSDVAEQISIFIDMGIVEESGKPQHRTMDWEQDANLIIPAVNRVVGREVRADIYLHWWTFLSAYMEIGECSFTHILNIRNKRAKHKKLEKWEEEFIRENKSVVELKRKLSQEDIAERKALEDLLG